MGTTPARFNAFTIYKGTTFSQQFTYYQSNGTKPIDLTGYDAKFEIKADENAVVPILVLTVGDGITLGGAAGTIDVEITPTDTALLIGFQGFFFLKISSGGVVDGLLIGDLKYSNSTL